MRDEDRYTDDGDDFGPSRSKRKRDAAELKDLGDELVALPDGDLEMLPLDEKLRDAIDLARRITAHGAAARQRQLIGKILRKTDVVAIRAAIEKRALERRLAAREFHRVETWRNRLVAEGDTAITALLAVAPAMDADELRRRVGAARAEAAAGRAPAEARELFRWLRENLAAAGGSA
jgi:ribosome-associated protein